MIWIHDENKTTKNKKTKTKTKRRKKKSILIYEKTGNERIREYVSKGGKYLGICAGGYYASSYVEFEKSTTLEVLGDRELSFFPGKAIG